MVLPILASVSGMPCNRKPSKIAAFDGVTFESITAGRSHTCALDSQGRAWCWGEGLMGQIGPNTPDTCGSGGADYPCSLEPVLVADTPIFSSLAAGGSHTCGIERTTGRLYCWGFGAYGQLTPDAPFCDDIHYYGHNLPPEDPICHSRPYTNPSWKFPFLHSCSRNHVRDTPCADRPIPVYLTSPRLRDNT